jgi:TonB family protein
MMSNQEHHPFCCYVTTVIRGGGHCAFAGTLALSLFIHLAAFSACVLLDAQAHPTPAKAAVIEIDLSTVDKGSGTQAANVSVSALQARAKRSANLRDHIAPPRSHPRSAERTAPRNPEQPSSVSEALGNPALEIDEAHGANDSSGTDVVAVAASGKKAETASGSGSEQVGNRDGDIVAKAERRGGGGHKAKAALAEYSQMVRALIERHKEYPFAARKFGIRGSVVVSFSLNCRGELRCLTLAKSSGNAMLDNAGMHAVREVGSFPPPPRHVMHGELVSFRIPITFAIAAG